jgi:NADPH2:quinone reductase
MKLIRVHQFGGPEALAYEDGPQPQPGPGQVLVKNAAIGVNYIDTYHRTGWYKLPLPVTPGVEAAGSVEAVGEGVTDFRPGDRVGFFTGPGHYAEYSTPPADRCVPLPAGLDERAAVAALIQGMTAYVLVHETFVLQPGHVALVHAAAGGVGLLLTQFAKECGARIIATVSTEAKAALARAAGADDVILYTQADFEAETQRLTDGQGVHVVYDSVGKTTFEKGLNVLRPRGMMVLYGAASGPAPMLDPNSLGGKGSLYVTRPSIFHYVAARSALLAAAGQVFDRVASGKLKLRLERTYPLAEAAQAHRDLESRATTGKLLLIP